MFKKGIQMKEEMNSMKDLLKQIQEMSKETPNTKKKIGCSTVLMSIIIFMLSSYFVFGWITFSIISILRLMDVL